MAININLGFVAQASGSDTIVATWSPAPASYYDKLLLWFRAGAANATTTPTINVNALGAKTIVKKGGQPLAAGDIPATDAIVQICYDSANNRFELLNPATNTDSDNQTLANVLTQGNQTLGTPIQISANDYIEGQDGNVRADFVDSFGNRYFAFTTDAGASVDAFVVIDGVNQNIVLNTPDGAVNLDPSLLYLSHLVSIRLNTPNVNLFQETASRALITDSSKNIKTSITTSIELSYLSGATSNIQAQINAITGAYVTSVNGFTGAVVLTTTNIAEGTNLYYTNARVDTQVATYTGDVTLTGTIFSIGALKVTNSQIANATINLTTKVTGILPVANGGTGVSTFGGVNTILYTTAADTLASSANLAYNGTGFLLGNPSVTGRRVDILQDTAQIAFGSLIGTTSLAAIYLNTTSGTPPSATNYTIQGGQTNTSISAPSSSGALNLQIVGNTRVQILNTSLSLTTGASSSGSTTKMAFTQNSHTAQTASTEVISVHFNNAFTLQHATGALTTQRTMVIDAMTYSFVGASTLTDAFTLQITGAPSAGANATITRAWGFSVIGNTQFQSKVYIGAASTAPTAYLHLAAGTTSANTAPLKFTTQANGLSTVEQGAMELIGNSLQFTQLAKRRGVAMSQAVIISDTTLGNSTTESGAVITAEHGANYLEVGKCEEIVLRGVIKQTNAGAGQLQLRVKYAGTTLTTTSTATGTISAGTPFEFRVTATCRSTGASGTMQFNCVLWIDGIANIPDSVSLATIDTTTAQNTTVTLQWTVANANNTVTVNQGRVLCIETNK